MEKNHAPYAKQIVGFLSDSDATQDEISQISAIVQTSRGLREALGHELLSCAAKNETAEVIEKIIGLELGKAVNVQDPQTEETALNWAAYHGNVDVTRLLIGVGADTNIRDDHQNTPLMIIVNDMTDLRNEGDPDRRSKTDRMAIATMLVEGGANISLKNGADETAMDIASKNGFPEIAAMLKNAPAREYVLSGLERAYGNPRGLLPT